MGIKGKVLVATEDSILYDIYQIEVTEQGYPNKDSKDGVRFQLTEPEKLTEVDAAALWTATEVHLVFEKEFFHFHNTKGVCMSRFHNCEWETTSLGMSYDFESCTCGEIS